MEFDPSDIERGSVSTRHGRVDYAAFGKGSKPFVLIPGTSLKPVTPLAKEIAKRYVIFRNRFRIYILDRGDYMPEGYTIRDMADDAADALMKLGVHDACVFGASQGGMIALVLAIKYPELVNKLVIGSSWSRPNEAGLARLRAWIRLAESGNAPALIKDTFRHMYSGAGADMIKAMTDAAGSDATAEELRKFAVKTAACCSFDIYEQLKKIKRPLLIIGAENDDVLGAAGSKEIAEKLNCESYIYPKADHAVYDEAPDYPERILRFFEE